MAILVLGKAAYLMLWKEGVIMVITRVAAPAKVGAGAGAPVKVHTDHAAPAAAKAEVNPRQ